MIAALERERDALDAPGHVEPVDPDDGSPDPGSACSCSAIAFAPSISPSMCSIRVRRSISRISCVATRSAVAQHRHAVAELEDLVEPVRDEDDAPALRDEVARRLEHALDLGLAERRGRLVEDEQARVADEQTGDLDELPLADRERLDGRPELHVAEAELVEDAARVLGEAATPVEERHVEPAEEDVVLDAELGNEAQLLVHERDAVRLRVVRVPERDLLAVEADHALVRPDEPDERLHERALAGAVVPADRVHLADPDVEREAPHGAHRAVATSRGRRPRGCTGAAEASPRANGIRTWWPDPVRRSSIEARTTALRRCRPS